MLKYYIPLCFLSTHRSLGVCKEKLKNTRSMTFFFTQGTTSCAHSLVWTSILSNNRSLFSLFLPLQDDVFRTEANTDAQLEIKNGHVVPDDTPPPAENNPPPEDEEEDRALWDFQGSRNAFTWTRYIIADIIRSCLHVIMLKFAKVSGGAFRGIGLLLQY